MKSNISRWSMYLSAAGVLLAVLPFIVPNKLAVNIYYLFYGGIVLYAAGWVLSIAAFWKKESSRAMDFIIFSPVVLGVAAMASLLLLAYGIGEK
ncbi:hypothetical protein ACFFJY_01230 [Fictibacillus aquaticus]|uniref:Uncharacterized protein n=1 Tax=Fictibacillus aquaticus TaxID=2021314 RepID=A0A235F7P8_9BACL|nr:hypothetical protein [Fictibacillus aquaticus]OYD57340.1 hypothetical protein CGZ90_11705 [Fictibacillus aquaticus]